MDDQWILTELGIQEFQAYRKSKKMSLRGFWDHKMGGRPASNWYNVIGKDGKSTSKQTIREILIAIGASPDDTRYYQRVAPAPQVSETALARLPEPITPFFGKAQEVADILQQLAEKRMLTLTGDVGSGKTRLALRVAEAGAAQFPDGVAMASLTALSEPRRIAQTVASALKIAEQAGVTCEERLIGYFGDKHFLLLLDNCEHLLPDCARLTGALLSACHNIKILATSRDGITLEAAVYPVMPLAESASALFFIDRVRAALPDCAATVENAPVIASLCSLLGGIPLTLELAAARVGTLPVSTIYAQLKARFDALTQEVRAPLSPAQILHATLDWTYAMLNPQEQAALRRLSVFVRGWTREAAEAVAGGAATPREEAANLLAALTRTRLAEAASREDAGRYHLPDAIREYGLQQLEANEAHEARTRHYTHYLTLAEQVEIGLESEDQQDLLRRMDADYANIQTALQWSLAEGKAENGLRLPGCLPGYWHTRGYLSEGLDWCQRALDASNPAARTQARAKLLNAAGGLALCRAQYALAEIYHQECLSIARELQIHGGLSNILNNLGLAAHTQGKSNLAITYYSECVDIRQRLGDESNTAYALNNLGMVYHTLEDYDTAMKHYNVAQTLFHSVQSKEGSAYTRVNIGFLTLDQKNPPAAKILFDKSLAFFTKIGYQEGLAETHHGLGGVALAVGDTATAWMQLEKSLIIREALPDPKGIAESLEGFAALAALQQQTERSVKLWGAANALRRRINTPLPQNKQAERARSLALARAMLEFQFTPLWDEGTALPYTKAIEYALQK